MLAAVVQVGCPPALEPGPPHGARSPKPHQKKPNSKATASAANQWPELFWDRRVPMTAPLATYWCESQPPVLVGAGPPNQRSDKRAIFCSAPTNPKRTPWQWRLKRHEAPTQTIGADGVAGAATKRQQPTHTPITAPNHRLTKRDGASIQTVVGGVGWPALPSHSHSAKLP